MKKIEKSDGGMKKYNNISFDFFFKLLFLT